MFAANGCHLTRRRNRDRLPQGRIRYFTFGIFTILPFACGSFGSFTTVTYNSFSPSLEATLVVPSPAAILNTCRSLPSGDIFKILPLSCHQPVAKVKMSTGDAPAGQWLGALFGLPFVVCRR